MNEQLIKDINKAFKIVNTFKQGWEDYLNEDASKTFETEELQAIYNYGCKSAMLDLFYN